MVEFELSWQFAFELAASTACLAAAWISLRIYQQRQRDDAASVAALERLRELCQNAPCLASKSTPDAVAQDMLAKFKDRGNSPDKPIRILSLDGGGVRGTYSARLLTRLEEAVPGLFDHIDVTAGTSTGVLVAGLLAMGYSPSLTQTIFNTGAVAIFRQPPWWREYNPFICNYDGKWKERCFKTITQDGTVKQLSKYLVCTAFRTHVSGEDTCSGKNYYGSKSHWHPDVITNLPLGPDKLPVQSHMDMELYKVAMLATAAPTWFPAYEGFIDGAMFANNPALEAVVRVMAVRPDVPIENIVVLSLGTGLFPNSFDLNGTWNHWGLLQWRHWIIELMFDSSRDATEFNLTMLLRDRFHRIQGALTDLVPLGDGRQHRLDNLIKDANDIDLTDAIAFVKRHFMT